MAIGACADLVVQPFGALIVGFLAGAISVWGFDIVSVNSIYKQISQFYFGIQKRGQYNYAIPI